MRGRYLLPCCENLSTYTVVCTACPATPTVDAPSEKLRRRPLASLSPLELSQPRCVISRRPYRCSKSARFAQHGWGRTGPIFMQR